MQKKPIPIVVLTKDEPAFLKLTVQSIINRTNHPFKIFIVDNNSTLVEQKEVLVTLSNNASITIIRNDKNKWVLGFNKAIDQIKTDNKLNQEFVVLSDGDIIVPNKKPNKCWLEYLIEQMHNNIAIGKIGLALDLGYLKTRESLIKTYNKELKFSKGQRIGELIVAPVDTTAALYRRDLFILDDFKMIPGHASLVKPYYYVTRTNDQYTAKHLGWRNYIKPSTEQLKDKVICFTKYAAYIDPAVLYKIDTKTRLFHKSTRLIFKSYWGLYVIFFWFKYIFKHFPRDLNEIQSNHR